MPAPKSQLLQTRTPTPSDEVVTSFFDLDGFADAVAGMEFTQREEVALLIDSMRCDDPKIRLAAQKQFHTLKKAILEANGLLGTARVKQTEDDGAGRVIEKTASVQTLLTRVREHQEKLSHVVSNRNDPSFQFIAPRSTAGAEGQAQVEAEAERPVDDRDSSASSEPLP